MIVVITAFAGCTQKRYYKSPWLVTEGDAAGYITEALDDPDADKRRGALDQVSKTRYADDDTVIVACKAIVTMDRSPSVRSAAIRILAESPRPDTGDVLLDLVEKPGDPAAAGPQVRVDVLNALYFLRRNEALSEAHVDRAAAFGIQLIREDNSRDVKIAAAILLGEFPRIESVNALVAALNHEDFGVVYHAEKSLVHLTGVRHDHDPGAWRSWLGSMDEPFARAGELDGEYAPITRPNWWQRLTTKVRRAFAGISNGSSDPSAPATAGASVDVETGIPSRDRE